MNSRHWQKVSLDQEPRQEIEKVERPVRKSEKVSLQQSETAEYSMGRWVQRAENGGGGLGKNGNSGF